MMHGPVRKMGWRAAVILLACSCVWCGCGRRSPKGTVSATVVDPTTRIEARALASYDRSEVGLSEHEPRVHVEVRSGIDSKWRRVATLSGVETLDLTWNRLEPDSGIGPRVHEGVAVLGVLSPEFLQVDEVVPRVWLESVDGRRVWVWVSIREGSAHTLSETGRTHLEGLRSMSGQPAR